MLDIASAIPVSNELQIETDYSAAQGLSVYILSGFLQYWEKHTNKKT